MHIGRRKLKLFVWVQIWYLVIDLDQCTMFFLKKKRIKCHFCWFAQDKIGTKNTKNVTKNIEKNLGWCKVARAELQAFQILSSTTFNFLLV